MNCAVEFPFQNVSHAICRVRADPGGTVVFVIATSLLYMPDSTSLVARLSDKSQPDALVATFEKGKH
jgi:hypothetical protein